MAHREAELKRRCGLVVSGLGSVRINVSRKSMRVIFVVEVGEVFHKS